MSRVLQAFLLVFLLRLPVVQEVQPLAAPQLAISAASGAPAKGETSHRITARGKGAGVRPVSKTFGAALQNRASVTPAVRSEPAVNCGLLFPVSRLSRADQARAPPFFFSN
ncbi:MAG TPA: hypothetical protein VKU01_33795 [Bryobacteraceae bacterium]|nr:hypothetical protein [Bryobacteraceae bacterium]